MPIDEVACVPVTNIDVPGVLTDEVKPIPVGVTSALADTVGFPKDEVSALPLKAYDC